MAAAAAEMTKALMMGKSEKIFSRKNPQNIVPDCMIPYGPSQCEET